MATANQKKKATVKQKPKAKSTVKTASKISAPKKNSAMNAAKKPEKPSVKSAPSKKASAKTPVKPVKKAVAGKAKPQKQIDRAPSAPKPKAVGASKAASPTRKSSDSKQKETKALVKKNEPVVVPPSSKAKPSPSKSVLPVKSVPPITSKSNNSVAGKTKEQTAPLKTSAAKKSPSKPVNSATKTAGKPAPTKGGAGDKKGKGDTPEPLQVKAEKAIREMEETMDLSKLRPRIQAGSSAPKPLVKHQQAPPLKLPEPTNTQKIKFQLEFEFRSSPKILFTSLSDSSGLAGWFADEVHTKDDTYTFSWEGGDSQAKLIAVRDLQLVRFQWLDDIADGTYFQFEIKEDDITSDVALVITDFALPGERETNIRLWESQVQKLRMLLGSL